MMQVAIFSFNRGNFLKNCVDSIERCAPWCQIKIFDDNSDDPSTRKLLDELATRYEIISPGPTGELESKHGGLYANMQRAYSSSTPGDIVCFLQDDMQFVRPLLEEEIDRISECFQNHAEFGFIQPTFFKGCDQSKNRELTRYDESLDLYFIDRFQNSAGASYSDVALASINNLNRIDWKFLPRESLNEQQARAKLGQMPYMRNPFVAWLPGVPAFRGKRQTVALRLAQRIRGCGFYPFEVMNEEEAARFKARNAQELPVAERFLKLVGSPDLKEPWFYHPLQGKRGLKWLNSIELRVQRLS